MRNIFKLLTALSLCCLNTGLNTNAMEQNPQESFYVKPIKSNEDSKKVKTNNIFLEENSSYFIKSSNDNVAIKLNYPFNLLVVADNEERMQKVTSLLCNNNLNLNLGDLKQLQDFHKYKSGGVYQAVNNPNVNIFCITLDDFNSNKFNHQYSWDFICQNTSKIFYVFNVDSQNNKSYFDKLKKFYHKFNKHWCGKDVNYNENYEPGLNTVWKENFQGPVLEKGSNDWFEYVKTKRNLINHRYIFFLLDNKEINYSKQFEKYIVKMPDARSISLCELNGDFTMGILLKNIQMHEDICPQKVILFNNDNIKKMSFKKIGLISTGGIGAIGTIAVVSSLIKKKLSAKPKVTKPEVKNQEVNKPGNNKLLT